MLVERKGRILDLAERVDPARTALLVVDVQNDFCHPEGAFGRLGHDLSVMPPMAERLRGLIREAGRLGILTVFIRATYDEEVLSGPLAENYHRRGFTESQCLEGSWGADWYGGVQPSGAPNEVVITKHRYSPFGGTPIDLCLRSNGIRTVIVTGVVTSGCVESTARDAFFRDYHVVVASDCVASASAAQHEASLRKMAQSFGVVLPAAEIQAAWAGADPGPRAWQAGRKAARVLPDLAARVEPGHTALVLIDLQNDFCDRAGAMGRRGEDLDFIQATLPAVRDLAAWARRAGVMVIHVRAEYGPLSASDVTAGTWAAWQAGDDAACCAPGTWGGEFVAGLGPVAREPVVVKHRYSAFVDTRLDLLLRSNGIRTVVVAGVATHCCVESTARDANMRDYYVVIPEDCVAVRGRMRHLHAASLETLKTYFGLVVPALAITEAWALRVPEVARA